MAAKTCPQCAKVFSRPGVMRAHLKAVHLGEKPFQCPQCPKAFGYKQALDEHARIAHQDVRPHACTECDRRFHKAADLKKHQAIHARKGFVYRSSREERVARLLEEEGLAFEREVRVDFEGGGLARLDFLLRMDWGLCALEVDEGAHCLREQAEEAERMLKVRARHPTSCASSATTPIASAWAGSWRRFRRASDTPGSCAPSASRRARTSRSCICATTRPSRTRRSRRSAKTQAFRRSSSLTLERTLDLGRRRLHEHQVRDLHEDAPAGRHEPALAQLDPHLAAPAGQVPELLQLLAAGVPDAHAIPVELELEEIVPAGAGLPAALQAGLHLVGRQGLAEDLGVRLGLLREQLHHLLLDFLHGGLLGLEANGHALGVGVVVGRGLPQDLLHFRGLPHNRPALAAQGQALAALGVGQKLPELDRHGWQGSLV